MRCTTCGLPMDDPNHDSTSGPPGCPGPYAAKSRREHDDFKAILADPEMRREMCVRIIISMGALQGIETSYEQAEAVYDQVLKEKGEPQPRFIVARGRLPDIDPDEPKTRDHIEWGPDGVPFKN